MTAPEFTRDSYKPYKELIQEVDPDLERLLAEEDEIDRQRAALKGNVLIEQLIAQLREQYAEAMSDAHAAYAQVQGYSRSARPKAMPEVIEHFAYASGLNLAITSLERL